MGIGDPPVAVPSDAQINNPVPPIDRDVTRNLDERLTVAERTLNAELVRQIRFLYDFLGLPYPPP